MSTIFPQFIREFLPPGSAPVNPAPQPEIRTPQGATYGVEDGTLVLRDRAGQAYASWPLPRADWTVAERSPAGDLWLGGPHGVVRLTGGSVEYYAGRRWLPADQVDALECLPDGSVVVHTPSGRSRLRSISLTLTQKAAHYERLTDARHERYGYVTGCRLLESGDLSSWQHNIDDNDGLWTAMYVAAQAFRFAVTGSADARSKARKSMQALLELERKTPIPGFPARALCHRDEPGFGAHPAGEWHPTPDGEWDWKADTSSDEIVGHYFAWQVYAELVADEGERQAIAEVCRSMTDHLLEHGLYLVDLDGKPTTWGVYPPEKLDHDPEWRCERGLNSLEILSHLSVASSLTGEARYGEAARELIEDHHYALNTVEQKILPGSFPGAENNHSDDELAFLSYYPLLRTEKDPDLRAIYLAGLERSWRIARPEENPLWNTMYGGLTGKTCDADRSTRALADIPLDLIRWPAVNSTRLDLGGRVPTDRFGKLQAASPLPWRERPLHKWNGNPYALDGGDGCHEMCATFWLLPYWLGRYHGIIE